MIMKTFYNDKGLVNRVIYHLPQHDAVKGITKMTLLQKNDSWYVIADVYPRQKGVVPSYESK